MASKLLKACWYAGDAAFGELVAKEPLARDPDGVASARAAAALANTAFSARCIAKAGETPLASKLLKVA